MWSSKWVWLGIGCALVGCQKETSDSSSRATDAGAPTKAKAIDPDLAQAVAAASARAPSTGAGAAGGPPPNGIFAPGAADKEIAAGQPPKITLGSDGAEPRVNLMPAQPKPGAKTSGTIALTVQSSPQGGLPVDLAVTFEASKPKLDEGVTNEVPVVVRVTSAKLSVTGAPKELEERVGKLKGAKVEYLVLPDGAGTGYRFDVPKAAGEELGDVVRALSDTLALVTLPYPDKPVGAGAFWMATSRDGMLGLDLVTYRLIKVEQVTPEKVTLNVNTKRYAASQRFDLPGLPADAPRTLVEFQSLSDGSVEVSPGKGFPIGGRQSSAVGAALGNEGAPAGERAMLEVRSRAELRLGGAAR